MKLFLRICAKKDERDVMVSLSSDISLHDDVCLLNLETLSGQTVDIYKIRMGDTTLEGIAQRLYEYE